MTKLYNICNKTTTYDGVNDAGFNSRMNQHVSRWRDGKFPRQVVTNNNIVSNSNIENSFFKSILWLVLKISILQEIFTIKRLWNFWQQRPLVKICLNEKKKKNEIDENKKHKYIDI